jgi:hypothetical protein
MEDGSWREKVECALNEVDLFLADLYEPRGHRSVAPRDHVLPLMSLHRPSTQARTLQRDNGILWLDGATPDGCSLAYLQPPAFLIATSPLDVVVRASGPLSAPRMRALTIN